MDDQNTIIIYKNLSLFFFSKGDVEMGRWKEIQRKFCARTTAWVCIKKPPFFGGGGEDKITVICMRNCDHCQFTDFILSLCILEIPVSNAQL